MGIKGCIPGLPRRAQRKTHKQGSAFLPKGNCRGYGRAGIRRYIHGFLAWKQVRKLYGFMVRVLQKQVLYLSAACLSNRKEGAQGQKGVRKTNRAAKPGLCPKGREGQCTPRSPQHFSSTAERLPLKRINPVRIRKMKPKSVQLQERTSTYCSAI